MKTMNELRVKTIRFERDDLVVEFNDGNQLHVPLDQLPRLRAATPAQRSDWSLIGRGLGVHWKAIDEDLSVENLLTAYSRSKVASYTGIQSKS